MTQDDVVLHFRTNHGFLSDFSNVAESTYDLLAILRYCVSDKMDYTEEAKAEIQKLIDWIEKPDSPLTTASSLPSLGDDE